MALPLSTSPRYGRFTLRTDCPRCGAHLPVNGPWLEVECSECGHVLSVPPTLVAGVLDTLEERFPAEVRETAEQGDLTWRWTAEPFAEPPCPQCAAPLTDVDGAGFVCEGCGTALSSEAPPVWLARHADRVLLRTAAPEAPPSEAIVWSCPSCAAGLRIDARNPRLSTCDHCGSQVHLPDTVWRAFHPKRTVLPWLARFDGESRPAKAAREEAQAAEARAEREAERRREKARRDEHRAAAQAKQQAEQEAKDAAQRAEKARLAAERAAADRLRNWWTLPLSVLSLLATLGAVALMGSGVLVFAWQQLTPARRIPRDVAFAASVYPPAVVALCVGVWAFAVVVAALRGNTGFGGTVFWSGFMMLLSHIPVVGLLLSLYWAWEHLWNREPTPETNVKLPFLTGTALALLHLTMPLYDAFVLMELAES